MDTTTSQANAPMFKNEEDANRIRKRNVYEQSSTNVIEDIGNDEKTMTQNNSSSKGQQPIGIYMKDDYHIHDDEWVQLQYEYLNMPLLKRKRLNNLRKNLQYTLTRNKLIDSTDIYQENKIKKEDSGVEESETPLKLKLTKLHKENMSIELENRRKEREVSTFVSQFQKIMAQSLGHDARYHPQSFYRDLMASRQELQLQTSSQSLKKPQQQKKKKKKKMEDDELEFSWDERELLRKQRWKAVCNDIAAQVKHWTTQHDGCVVIARKNARKVCSELIIKVRRSVRHSSEQTAVRARKIYRDMRTLHKTKWQGDKPHEGYCKKMPRKNPKGGEFILSEDDIIAAEEAYELEQELMMEDDQERGMSAKEKRTMLKEQRRERKKKLEEEEKARQERKLNFLLTKTELFSHFMSGKTTPAPKPLIDSNETENMENKDQGGFALSGEAATKAAMRAIENQKARTAEFDNQLAILQGKRDRMEDDEEAPTTTAHQSSGPVIFSEPKHFKGKLKEFQKKGLTWLASLFDQGINGILADEMGLGKTVQTISFLAHLAQVKNIWGPFVVVAPASTLHNWEREIKKFYPQFKTLPYWGLPKVRRVLRRSMNPDLLYKKESPFHIIVTSYNILLEDLKTFNRIKWQYMVLDEAHWIKSSKSMRWKQMLGFNCRNRLLLTGTPIQNNMAELWSLLHFIMPTLFDSHEEFDRWFSKDIETKMAKKGSKLNQEQLNRLHMILNPFMLRRIKLDVQSEMPPKTEVQIPCHMSSRQKAIASYLKHILHQNKVKNKTAKKKTLMNLVMQFRKMCNHPQLFERDTVSTPFRFAPPIVVQEILDKSVTGHFPEVFSSEHQTHLSVTVPKLFYRRGCGVLKGGGVPSYFFKTKDQQMMDILASVLPNVAASMTTKELVNDYNQVEVTESDYTALFRKFSIHRLDYVHDSLQGNSNGFAFLKFMDMTLSEYRFVQTADVFDQYLAYVYKLNHMMRMHYLLAQYKEYGTDIPDQAAQFLIDEHPLSPIHRQSNFLSDSTRRVYRDMIFLDKPNEYLREHIRPHLFWIAHPRVDAAPARLFCADRSFSRKHLESLHQPYVKLLMNGFTLASAHHQQPISLHYKNGEPTNEPIPYAHAQPGFFTANHTTSDSVLIQPYRRSIHYPQNSRKQNYFGGLNTAYHETIGDHNIRMPSVSKLVADSGKMQVLDKLLKRLHKEGHRVLIFSQMTKMMDILESLLWGRAYKFCRLDGTTNVQDRNQMVNAYNTDYSYFAFLLSTRAGGLGINLTSADTVIFYDVDWNPTQDQQAMDRCHRIGQNKPVTVYRIIASNSIEDRMIQIAKRKLAIQDTVYRGEFKKFEDEPTDDELIQALFDEDDDDETSDSGSKEIDPRYRINDDEGGDDDDEEGNLVDPDRLDEQEEEENTSDSTSTSTTSNASNAQKKSKRIRKRSPAVSDDLLEETEKPSQVKRLDS